MQAMALISTRLSVPASVRSMAFAAWVVACIQGSEL